MKVTFRIPTQTYGYLELEGTEEDLEKMESLHQKYAEFPLQFGAEKGGLLKHTTYTGETVYYDAVAHKYQDEKGNVLLSGSAFKKLNEKPFDKEKMCSMVGKKYGISADVISKMWDGSSKISTTFGTALHNALEHWYRYKDFGTEKEYHFTKNPILRLAIETFPLKDTDIMPELMVSDVKRFMAGQIDGLIITGEKQAVIIDYKTDADIKKNLPGHFLQLSFYADILKAHGWDIPIIQVWNYTGEWQCYESKPVSVESYKPFKK